MCLEEVFAFQLLALTLVSLGMLLISAAVSWLMLEKAEQMHACAESAVDRNWGDF